jgi:electron transport complex protein RnfG
MEKREAFKKGLTFTAFLALILFISGTALTITYKLAENKIIQQKKIKIEKMIKGIFLDMTDYTYDEDKDLYLIYSSGNLIGYAFLAKGRGYGGNIDVLVGLEDENTIKGVRIVKHSETPGLGARITEEGFLSQFKNIGINDALLKKEGGRIDAITGSTISSKAVTEAVYEAAKEKVKLLEKRG